jgi:hypothetical protein
MITTLANHFPAQKMAQRKQTDLFRIQLFCTIIKQLSRLQRIKKASILRCNNSTQPEAQALLTKTHRLWMTEIRPDRKTRTSLESVAL